jgi:hypothetical protein
MKDKVEMKYVSSEATNFTSFAQDSGYWELTVQNKFIGTKTVELSVDVAMTVAMAVATARDLGRREASTNKKNDKHR